ncbi:HEC/Ndc80p family-domain-containing protein [Melampsora americana]|nr:HEC/Ndc80p family-domain-containing protein [Melampsora americana]
MDPRRRTLAATEPQASSHIPVPSSALKRQVPQTINREANTRYSLAPQRSTSTLQSSRQSYLPGNSQPKYSQSSDPLINSSQTSNHQRSNSHQNDPRRSSVYQAPYNTLRQSTSTGNLPNATRMPASASRPDHAHLRYSNMNDFAPNVALHYPVTPGSNVNRPNFQNSGQRISSAAMTFPSHNQPNAVFGAPLFFKDPRPRDKKIIAGWQQDVHDFLVERGYVAITIKTLQTPTNKDFQNILKFLVQCSDPGHRWGMNGKKFEDEVLPLLKQMGYVAVDAISKSGLQAAGSMHTWPTMLAMLHWIVMTIKLCEEARTNPHIYLDPNSEPSSQDLHAQAMATHSRWFEYLGRTYPSFLQTDDYDKELHKPPLEDYYQRQRDGLLSELEQLESIAAMQEADAARMKARPSPLEASQKEHAKLARDAEGFSTYISKMKDQILKSEKQNEALQKSLVASELKVKDLAHKKADLLVKVEKQNISDAELQQISSTRVQLERSAAAAATKHLQLTEAMMDLEIKSSQASDRLEKLITSYQNKAVKLGLIPRAPEPFDEIDFSQSVNGGSDQLPDPTIEIKPALIQLKKNAIESRLGLTDQVLSMEEKLLNVNETEQEKRESLQVLEMSVQELTKQLEEDKEKFSLEMSMMNEQTESLLRRIHELQSVRENNQLTLKHEVEALKVRYSETKRRIAQLTKENVDEMNSTLGVIIRHKESIREKTRMLKSLADSMGDSNLMSEI